MFIREGVLPNPVVSMAFVWFSAAPLNHSNTCAVHTQRTIAVAATQV